MLDDSLTAGHLEPTNPADSSSSTVGDTRGAPDKRDPERDLEHALAVGDRFAGFQIRGFLGRGAMGVVYDAWDPTLERRVALKLLRSPTRRAAERLLREARALARLDHPNVVRIWAADVHRGAVYIAMELVEGQNLREWMKTPRTWAEALPVMLGAARGLAAAHAARVIHRDFKPENVLVGWDGQARVLDFGIARIAAQHPDHLTSTIDGGISHDGEGEAHCGSEALSGSFAALPVHDVTDALTEAGALIGTLLYMAPEQHERQKADERSDEFAFCTTLFEVIYGAHPFPAKNRSELTLRVAEGRIAFPEPLRAKPPRWLERVIVRGLSRLPEQRFASIDELIEALERYPRRRRARNRVLAGAAVLAGAVTLGVMVPRAEPTDPCIDVATELDAALSQAERREIAERFATLDEPWAAELGKRVDTSLEAWAARWVEARVQICELRHAHREATVIDEHREACLADQLADVAALGDVFVGAQKSVLINAERALIALPDPDVCLGEDPPVGRGLLAADQALVEELAKLEWFALAGGDTRTLRRTRALVEQLRLLPRTAANDSLLGDALVTLAEAEMVDGDPETAELVLHEAIRMAELSASDGLRAHAVIDLGWLLATTPGRSREAQLLLEDAGALLERIGSPRHQSIRRRQALAEALLANGEPAQARAMFKAVLVDAGQDASASIHGTTALGLSRVAKAENNPTLELEHAQTALAIMEAHRADSMFLAAPLNNMADALIQLGRYAEARAAIERSVEIRREQLADEVSPGNRRRLGESLLNLANLESKSGNPDAASDAYREVLALLPEEDYANRSLALFNLGVDHQIAGRRSQALANYEQALRFAERVLPFEHPQVAGARLGVGSMLVSLERPAEARGPLERCAEEWPENLVGTYDEGELKFALAQTLLALDGWSERAGTLAREAGAIYRKLGDVAQAERIDAWLVANGP